MNYHYVICPVQILAFVYKTTNCMLFQGDIYARPKKPSSKPSSEIDEFMNTSLPHRSSSKTLQQSRLDSV